jgi:hypothetical protein
MAISLYTCKGFEVALIDQHNGQPGQAFATDY